MESESSSISTLGENDFATGIGAGFGRSLTTAVFVRGAGNNLESLTDNYSLRVTETGVDFYKEYEVNGIKFKLLTFKPATAAYPDGYYENAAGTIKLVPIS